jgi:outer membrane protein TolC
MEGQLKPSAWSACLLVSIGLCTASLGDETKHQHPTAPATGSRLAVAALALDDLERMALQGNPTLAQAAAAVDASRGKALQAGLYPNPTIG